jgi:hypothetical protein
MKYSLALALWASLFVLEGGARADTVPVNSVSVRSISYGGPGCVPGTVASVVSQDGQYITLLFSALAASVGPGAKADAARRECNITMVLDHPRGYSFSLVSADIRGFVLLDPGVSGRSRTTYSFPGLSREERTFEASFQGPLVDDYLRHDALPASLYSPCTGRSNLQLKTELSLDDSNAQGAKGLLTADSADGVLKQTFLLDWRTCP